jgi:hypothetical protein
MAAPEQQNLPEPERWREPVDATIEIAQIRRPEMWARYDAIAGELEGPPLETAARRRLSRPRWQWEGVDWDFLFAMAGPSRHGAQAVSPMNGAERYRLNLEREALHLEDELRVLLVEELRQQRWSGEAISERNGRSRKIPLSTWFVAGLSFDLRSRTVAPGSAPKLLGFRLRPRLSGRQVLSAEPRRWSASRQTDPRSARVRDPIRRQRLAVLSVVKAKITQGESPPAAVRRLQDQGVIEKVLPGRRNSTEDTRFRELLRLWARV